MNEIWRIGIIIIVGIIVILSVLTVMLIKPFEHLQNQSNSGVSQNQNLTIVTEESATHATENISQNLQQLNSGLEELERVLP